MNFDLNLKKYMVTTLI